MTNLKCPFCGCELEDAQIHSSGLYFECPNCYAKQKEKDDNYTATPKVWQELIRTRKALDVATGFIKGISQTVINDCDNQYVVLGNFKKFAEDTLNQIKTALEQKDVK